MLNVIILSNHERAWLAHQCTFVEKIARHIELSYILQPPKYLLLFVNRFRYINNNITKDRCPIPMDTTVGLGPLKFSLQATIDHHGPSIDSGHHTASVNCCKKTFYCNDHKITEFGITDKNSSTAYIVLYKWIDTWFLASNRRVGVWSLPWRCHILSIPLTTGRGTSAETCGLDDVFPLDDLGSRPEALCWYICIYIYVCMYIPYTSSVIGRIYNGSVIQYWRSCTPSRSIGECAVPGLNATFCFLWFTNCVLLFDKNLILGCLWLLVFVLNNILILAIWCSTIPHLPGCFVSGPSLRISDSTRC